MGLPTTSPRSERFHGTMYSTFGNSRLPVISVVSSSSRSGPLRPPVLAAVVPWRVPLVVEAVPGADGAACGESAGAAAGAEAAEGAGAGAAARGVVGAAVDVCPEVGAA